MTLKEAIEFIISHEPDYERKLDLLTDISIGTSSREVHEASESVRNDVIPDEVNNEDNTTSLPEMEA